MGSSRTESKKPQKFTADLSSAALNFVTTYPSKPFKLDEIGFTVDEAITETVTITLDSVLGAAFDRVLAEVDLIPLSGDTKTEFTFRPQGDSKYRAGDQIRIQITKANSLGDVSGEINSSEIGGG